MLAELRSPQRAEKRHSQIEAISGKNHSCRIGRGSETILRKRNPGTSLTQSLDAIAGRETAIGRKSRSSQNQN
jgi:hypothetical protein